jgi:hypothetical protein
MNKLFAITVVLFSNNVSIAARDTVVPDNLLRAIRQVETSNQKSPSRGDNGKALDLNMLKQSIAEIETSSGMNNKPRFEPNFLKKYGNNGLMPKLRNLYGDKAASSSYGQYQIMLVVAWENGFEFSPDELSKDVNNEKVYNKIISKIITKVGNDLIKIGQKYNGSKTYGEKLKKIYERRKSSKVS